MRCDVNASYVPLMVTAVLCLEAIITFYALQNIDRIRIFIMILDLIFWDDMLEID